MTATRFLGGIVLALVAYAPLVVGSDRLRRAVLPDWAGLEGALADAVLVVAATVVVTEALGTVGLLKPVPAVLALAAVGIAGWLVASRLRRSRATVPAPVEPDRLPAWATWTSVGGIALVVGSWLARTVQALQHGMTTVDTLWYHLPIAVRWVQTGRTTGIQFFDSDPVTAYYPASSSLFHAVGFLFFRSDLISAVINLGWLALALAAGWSAGRAFGVGPATALGTALLLGTAGMVGTQPAGAYDDVVGLALLLTAVAFVLHRRGEPRRLAHVVLIGLTLGLCVGTKYTFVAPSVLLALGVVVTTERGRRIRTTLAVLLAACVTGSYWYVRNAVVIGNPLPSLAFHLGPISLPSVKGAQPTATVAKFLFDSAAWRQQMLPGLRLSLGPAWPVLVVLAFAGMAAAIVQRHESVVRMLGVVALLSFLAYLVTPQYLVALGRPVFFGVNIRYASPGLVLGLVLLPIALRRWAAWVAGALVATLLVTELDPTSWPTGFGWKTFVTRVGVGDAVWALALVAVLAGIGVGATALWRRAGREPTRTRRRIGRWAVVAAIVLLGFAALAGVRGEYQRNRYVGLDPFPQLTSWVRGQHRARILVAGLFMQDQYPMAGADLSNWVQVAGVKTSGGGFRAVTSCEEWVRLLEDGHYDDVVVLPALNIPQWTAAQPDARLVVNGRLSKTPTGYVVYRLDPSLRHRTCNTA
jgi:hypothetical protein